MTALAVGARAEVRVPATSANLGPGFDCMGLALDRHDRSAVEVLGGGLEFRLSGEGADQVPRDASHLVVRVLQEALADLGATAPGLRLEAHNVIPHSRGLGSSAAAIVAGLGLAWGLARPGQELDLDWACQRASAAEGHPDNACAAVLGGVVLAWLDGDRYRVARLEPAPGLECEVFVPRRQVPTAGARGVLPAAVPRADAVLQATCSALLVHALTRTPEDLLFATQDWLHQRQRAPLMPESAALVERLRAVGVPAVISGAGPTVLALGTPRQLAAGRQVAAGDFVRERLALGRGVAVVGS